MVVSTRRVQVHIDALVLRGVAPEDAHRMTGGLFRELTREIAEAAGGAAFNNRAPIATLRLGVVRTAPGDSPEARGRRAGRHLAKGICR